MYSILTTERKTNLVEKFSVLAETKASELTKLPLDAFYDILEQDFAFKMAYNTADTSKAARKENVILFSEEKKKVNVESMDILMYLLKLFRECKIMSFSNDHL